MRARLGFSVAIYADPDVVLLDEVLGVGDTLKSVILVSHQPAMHRQLCDRLVWIEGGIVQDVGAVKTVLEKYLEYHKERRI